MKTLLLLSFILVQHLSAAQSVLKALGKDKSIKRDKEFCLELDEAFDTAKSQFDVDFDISDTVFIIRGMDVQSRQGFGYIWNNKLKIRYRDNKTWKRGRLLASNPLIEGRFETDSWHEFEGLVAIIEDWDIVGIERYVTNCDTVVSGIHNWLITRVSKANHGYLVEHTTVRDFGRCP